jgi:hypothetical protein
MPQLADQLTAIHIKIEQRTKELKALGDDSVKSQTTQSLQLQLLTSGGLTFRPEALQLPPQLSPSQPPASTYASAQASLTATP